MENVRQQIRENNEELQDFLRDLGNWEKEMKMKDEELRKKQKDPKQKPIEDVETSKEKTIEKAMEEETPSDSTAKELDKEKTNSQQLKQKAVLEKARGNRFFSEGKYDDAIACYTSGMQADPKNAVLPANRAMALIKKGQLAAAEQDCTLSISLDCKYAKAFYRRATCRLALKKLILARQDFLKVLELEPGNKFACDELNKLEEEFAKINKPESESKKKCTEPKETHSTAKEDETRKQVPSPVDTAESRVEELFSRASTSSQQCTTSQAVQSVDKPSVTEMGSKPEKKSFFSNITGQIKPVYKAAHLKSKKPLERITIEVHSSDEELEELSLQSGGEPASWTPSSAPGPSKSSPSQRHSASVPTIPSIPEKLPPVPHTAFQFESDWRKLRHWPHLRTQYLRNLSPEILQRMYQQSMETDIFINIIHCIQDICKDDPKSALLYLKCLTQVGRFSTTVLFLSSDETQVVKNILKVISEAGDSEEVKNLHSLYKI